jgi:uncharacterized protein (DUF2141 family)
MLHLSNFKIYRIAFLLYFSLIPIGTALSINIKKISVPVAISVTIKDIKTPKGQILMGIYKDDVSFDKEIPYKKVQSFKTKISNGTLQIEVKLEPGKYGISLMDDENFNGKMDYSFLGIPKEGFGFSNYYHTGLTKPKLTSFAFEVLENKNPKVEVKMRYM